MARAPAGTFPHQPHCTPARPHPQPGSWPPTPLWPAGRRGHCSPTLAETPTEQPRMGLATSGELGPWPGAVTKDSGRDVTWGWLRGSICSPRSLCVMQLHPGPPAESLDRTVSPQKHHSGWAGHASPRGTTETAVSVPVPHTSSQEGQMVTRSHRWPGQATASTLHTHSTCPPHL